MYSDSELRNKPLRFFGCNSDLDKFLSPVFTKLSGMDGEGGE